MQRIGIAMAKALTYFTAAEFARVHGIGRYNITRNKSLFQWETRPEWTQEKLADSQHNTHIIQTIKARLEQRKLNTKS